MARTRGLPINLKKKGSLSSLASSILGDHKSRPPVGSYAIAECRICMEFPTAPVATSCGHMFCWPCLNRWLDIEPKPCPVCRRDLTTHEGILALHLPGEANKRPPSGDASTSGATLGINPPRPRNPLLFYPLPLSRDGEPDSIDLYFEATLLLDRSRRVVDVGEQQASLVRQLLDLRIRSQQLIDEAQAMELHLHKLQKKLQRKLARVKQQQSSGSG